jgi:hypothetical protein
MTQGGKGQGERRLSYTCTREVESRRTLATKPGALPGWYTILNLVGPVAVLDAPKDIFRDTVSV